MSTVVIVLKDTPAGGVSVRTRFTPAVGNQPTAAQQAALEILRRTQAEWSKPATNQNGIHP